MAEFKNYIDVFIVFKEMFKADNMLMM